jgi:hypothetical protein
MRSRGLALVVLAAMILIVVLLLRGDETGSSPSPSADGSGAELSGASGEGAPPAPVAGQAGFERAEVDPAAAAEPAGAVATPLDPALAMIFRGRCVESPGSAGLAGVQIKLVGRESRDTGGLTAEKNPWTNPPPFATDADGRFEILIPEAPEREFYLTFLRADRCMRAAHYESGMRAGQVTDMGEIVMPGGQRIAGFMIDQEGKPAANVMLSIDGLSSAVHPAMRAGETMGVKSGPDGSFAYEAALPPGTYSLRIPHVGWSIPEPRELVVADPHPAETIIRLRRQETAEGLVVDEDGQPVAGVSIKPKWQGEGRVNDTASRDDGSFRFYQREEGTQIVSLELMGSPIEPQTWNSPVPWGTRGLRVQVKRLPTVQLTVVERASGAPVVDFGIRSSRVAGRELLAAMRHPGPHPGGQVEVSGMQNGRNYLLIIPKDPGLLPQRDLLVEVKDGKAKPVRVELDRMRTLQVRVVGKEGKPVPHSDILLLDAQPERDSGWMDPRDDGRSIGNLKEGTRAPMAFSKAESGPDGHATLTAPPGAPELFFQVRGEHLPLDVKVEDPFAKPAPLLLTVKRGGIIRGRLLHPDVASGLFSVALYPPESKANFGEGERMLANEGGAGSATFAFSGLNPGNYRLQLVQRLEPPLDDFGFGDRWMAYPDTEINVLLAEDEVREVDLDANAYGTGSAEIRALLDGVPAANCPIALMRIESDRRKQQRSYGGKSCDSGGNSLVEHVAPGTYYATLVVKGPDGFEAELVSSNRIQLVSGQRTTADLQFHWRSVRFLVQAAETGEPLAGWQFVNRREFRGILLTDKPGRPDMTDADGVFTFVGAPVGSLTLSFFKDGVLRTTEAVHLPEVLGTEILVVKAAVRELDLR